MAIAVYNTSTAKAKHSLGDSSIAPRMLTAIGHLQRISLKFPEEAKSVLEAVFKTYTIIGFLLRS